MSMQAWKQWLCRCVVFGLVINGLPVHPVRAQSPVVIGEVAWAGSSITTYDEWVELWNVGSDTVSLAGYKLIGASGTNAIAFASTDAISPGKTFVLAHYAPSSGKTVMTIQPDKIVTSIALPNTALGLQLVDPNGTVVDSAGNGSAPPAGSNGSTVNATMIRLATIQDGTQKTSWVTATVAQNVLAGHADLGTPGFCDGCAALPSTATAPIIATASTTDTTTSATTDTTAQTCPQTTSATSDTTYATPTDSQTTTATATSDTTQSSVDGTVTTTTVSCPCAPISITTQVLAKHKSATSTKSVVKKPKKTKAKTAPKKTSKPKPAVKSRKRPTASATSTSHTPTVLRAVSSSDHIQFTAKHLDNRSIPMALDQPSNTRVFVQGIVASIPGLLNKNQFVIQTEDGRGLLVQGNGRDISPPFGAMVKMTGTLLINDQGAILRMGTYDVWTALGENSTGVSPRTIDLNVPGSEDAWSLLAVTGTVTAVNGAVVHLNLDDATVGVVIRPVIKYRAARLKVGDIIAVTGLADTRGEEVKIFPRSADDIRLLRSAPNVTNVNATSTNGGVPPWTPVGSAGGAVVAVEGVKWLQKIREQRRLAKLLMQGGNSIT